MFEYATARDLFDAARDAAQDVRFYSMSGAWPIESDGYCWQCGRMSAHTQACVLFDGSK